MWMVELLLPAINFGALPRAWREANLVGRRVYRRVSRRAVPMRPIEEDELCAICYDELEPSDAAPKAAVRIAAVHDVFVPENTTRYIGRTTPGMEGAPGIHKRHLLVKLQARPARPRTRAENRERLVEFFVNGATTC